MSVTSARLSLLGLPVLCGVLLLSAACTTTPTTTELPFATLDPQRQVMALREAKTLRSNGKRVWCVPYARNVSGIEIRGNAETWWHKASGIYQQGNAPKVGAVMAFDSTRSMPMGHVAVVSEVVSAREIKVDHANWLRNQVSIKMAVVDVSKTNDWSAVRVESQPSAFGRVYPVNGFIYPKVQ